MARSSRVYKLYSSTLANGEAALTIAQAGVITGISFDIAALNGAVVNNAETHELALNSATAALTTNDSVTSLAQCSVSNNIASSGCSAQKTILGMAVSVQPGDRLVLNGATAGGGAAMASRAVTCHIYVS